MEAQEEVDERMDECVVVSFFNVSIQLTLGATLVLSDPAPLARRLKKPSTYSDSSSRPTRKEALKEAFLKLQFCETDDEPTTLMARANPNASEKYTNVLLSHARLYTFAEE